MNILDIRIHNWTREPKYLRKIPKGTHRIWIFTRYKVYCVLTNICSIFISRYQQRLLGLRPQLSSPCYTNEFYFVTVSRNVLCIKGQRGRGLYPLDIVLLLCVWESGQHCYQTWANIDTAACIRCLLWRRITDKICPTLQCWDRFSVPYPDNNPVSSSHVLHRESQEFS